MVHRDRRLKSGRRAFLFLSAILCCTLLPAAAFADEAANNDAVLSVEMTDGVVDGPTDDADMSPDDGAYDLSASDANGEQDAVVLAAAPEDEFVDHGALVKGADFDSGLGEASGSPKVDGIPTEGADPVGDAAADGQVQADGWKETEAGWTFWANGAQVTSGWVVNDTVPGEQSSTSFNRYWIASDGILATNRLIDPEEGAGWRAFATSTGSVVRGKWIDPVSGLVYLANNDGVLEHDGWLISGAYSDGRLERYYVDESVHAVVPGYSDGGWTHYSLETGETLRGGVDTPEGKRWADNDGRLKQSGWLVYNFGTKLERYWFEAGLAVQNRLVDPSVDGSGYFAYATDSGAVVRGSWTNAQTGNVYLADNDGKLENPGWLVSSSYSSDGSLQRYWIDAKLHACVPGLCDEGWSHYTLVDGTVLRGATAVDGLQYYADGHGRLVSGWVVTSAFGQGLQRYWLRNGLSARLELISEEEAGWWAYATDAGYVVRGKWIHPKTGVAYLANNDGNLCQSGWIVTKAYDGNMQRYYIDEESHGSRVGYFNVEGERYLGLSDLGYVLRGAYSYVDPIDGSMTVFANNDGVLAVNFSSSAAAANGSAAKVVTSFVGEAGDQYLFLPSFADLSNVVLEFGGEAEVDTIHVSLDGASDQVFGSGDSLDLSAHDKNNGKVTLTFWRVDQTSKCVLHVMKSEQVSALFLLSDDPIEKGRPYIEGSKDHSAKTTGKMLLADDSGSIVYDGNLTQIKGRGNTTWHASEKKPYQIKLSSKTDLLSSGNKSNRSKTWVLLANANDATLLHNTVAYQLAQALGVGATPETRPVDLYYDGEYRGSYLLSEKVQIGSGRVDIFDLEDAVEDANKGDDLGDHVLAQSVNAYGYEFQYVADVEAPSSYDGGYLLEYDAAYYASERSWFNTSAGAFVVKSPENLSYEMMLYISEKMQAAINAANSDAADSDIVLSNHLDVNSAAAMYLLNEFAKNRDWGLSSSYFYVPSTTDRGFENIVYAGPAWDFDAAFGIRKAWQTDQSPEGNLFMNDHTPWLLSSSTVRDAAETMAESVLLPYVKDVLLGSGEGSLSNLIEQLSASQRMDEVLWGLTSFNNAVDPLPTYEENTQYFNNWLSDRAAWIEQNGLFPSA